MAKNDNASGSFEAGISSSRVRAAGADDIRTSPRENPHEKKKDIGFRLDAAQSRHLARMHARLREAIVDAGGSIPFSRYMDLALHAPGLGYYRADWHTFGEAGDFITAPEITPLFARSLARQIEQALGALGACDVLEFGAGSGAMAAEIIASLAAKIPLRYRILEPGAALARRQRKSVAERIPEALETANEKRKRDAGPSVEWIDRLPPPGFRGVIIANEVVDALAVERFEVQGEEIFEHFVGWGEEGPLSIRAPARTAIEKEVRRIEADLGRRFASGYRSEIGPARKAWVASVAQTIERGLLLIIDYGYPQHELYHVDRREGTLRCHFRHRRHDDPLALAGLQDISAHVDFSALAAASGMEVAGFTTQGDFLIACGLLDLIEDIPPGTPEFLRCAERIKRITLPGEMGEVCKVMGLGRGLNEAMIGFSGRDHRPRLRPEPEAASVDERRR